MGSGWEVSIRSGLTNVEDREMRLHRSTSSKRLDDDHGESWLKALWMEVILPTITKHQTSMEIEVLGGRLQMNPNTPTVEDILGQVENGSKNH